MNILRLLLLRVLAGLATLAVVTALIFLGTEMLPGDVATAILGQDATPESVRVLRASLGLDQPALARFLNTVSGFIHGDFGASLATGRPIAPDLLARLSNTLILAAAAAAISIPLALLLGIATAALQNSVFDRVANVVSLAATGMPEFFIAYLLIIVFSTGLGWFPSLSIPTSSLGLSGWLLILALPTISLVIAVFAHMMRMTRASLAGVLSSAYIEMGVLKGLRPRRIVAVHALPNALAPILNIIAILVSYLIVGVVVVEVIFVYPGIGQMMVDAVAKRDVPVVQACGVIFAATYTLLNMTADILAMLANPRLRHAR